MSAGTDDPFRCSHCGQILSADLSKTCTCPTDIAYRWSPNGAVETTKIRSPLTTEEIDIAALHLAAAAMDVAPEHVAVLDEGWKRRAISLLRALGL